MVFFSSRYAYDPNNRTDEKKNKINEAQEIRKIFIATFVWLYCASYTFIAGINSLITRATNPSVEVRSAAQGRGDEEGCDSARAIVSMRAHAPAVTFKANEAQRGSSFSPSVNALNPINVKDSASARCRCRVHRRSSLLLSERSICSAAEGEPLSPEPFDFFD